MAKKKALNWLYSQRNYVLGAYVLPSDGVIFKVKSDLWDPERTASANFL